MEEDAFRDLSDDHLIAWIEPLDMSTARSPELDAALAEMCRRLRAEASLKDHDHVEAVIGRLTETFDADDGSDEAGVRAPRRKPPDAGAGSIRLAS